MNWILKGNVCDDFFELILLLSLSSGRSDQVLGDLRALSRVVTLRVALGEGIFSVQKALFGRAFLPEIEGSVLGSELMGVASVDEGLGVEVHFLSLLELFVGMGPIPISELLISDLDFRGVLERLIFEFFEFQISLSEKRVNEHELVQEIKGDFLLDARHLEDDVLDFPLLSHYFEVFLILTEKLSLSHQQEELVLGYHAVFPRLVYREVESLHQLGEVVLEKSHLFALVFLDLQLKDSSFRLFLQVHELLEVLQLEELARLDSRLLLAL